MAQIKTTILLLCIATAYAASITNISDEDFSMELEETPRSPSENSEKSGQITEYDPITPSFIVSENIQSNGFQMGKSMVEGLLGLLQILRQMSMNQEGLKNISFLVANMVSMFAGQYYDTLKKLMPVFSGMVTALLQTLR